MNVKIRTETPEDYSAVSDVVEEAFRAGDMEFANEHLLVERLRKSESFIPELSIVAVLEGEIVGHILLTKTKIRNSSDSFDSLALAPVSVKPAFQKKGIGAELILEAHIRARELGWTSINLVGHKDYYPRFAYKRISTYGIDFPFDAPDENCMIIELVADSLKGVRGTIEYDKAFFE